jgi:hypothetical protein
MGNEMSKKLAAGLVMLHSLIFTDANAAEVEIPRSMADKGKYYLIDAKSKNGITTTVHKRVGVNETGYSRTEINCKSMQYRDMGYSEAGVDKISGTPRKVD